MQYHHPGVEHFRHLIDCVDALGHKQCAHVQSYAASSPLYAIDAILNDDLSQYGDQLVQYLQSSGQYLRQSMQQNAAIPSEFFANMSHFFSAILSHLQQQRLELMQGKQLHQTSSATTAGPQTSQQHAASKAPSGSQHLPSGQAWGSSTQQQPWFKHQHLAQASQQPGASCAAQQPASLPPGGLATPWRARPRWQQLASQQPAGITASPMDLGTPQQQQHITQASWAQQAPPTGPRTPPGSPFVPPLPLTTPPPTPPSVKITHPGITITRKATASSSQAPGSDILADATNSSKDAPTAVALQQQTKLQKQRQGSDARRALRSNSNSSNCSSSSNSRTQQEPAGTKAAPAAANLHQASISQGGNSRGSSRSGSRPPTSQGAAAGAHAASSKQVPALPASSASTPSAAGSTPNRRARRKAKAAAAKAAALQVTAVKGSRLAKGKGRGREE